MRVRGRATSRSAVGVEPDAAGDLSVEGLDDADVVRLALRRGHDARVSAVTTAYGLFLVAVMFGAMGLAALMRAVSENVAAGVQGWMPSVLAVAGAAGVLRGCLAAGPIHADQAIARWLLPSPIRRWLVLRSRAVLTWCLAALAGGVTGVVVAVVSHPGGVVWSRVTVGVALGAVVGAALFVVGVVAQVRSWTTILGRSCLAVALACCVTALVGMREGWRVSTPASTGRVACVVVLLLASVVVAVGVARLSRWAERVRSRDAAAAGALVSAATGSVVMLDAGAFDVRRDARRLARRGWAASRPSRGPLWVDVVVRDLRGCLRRWPEVVGALVGVVPAVMLGQLFGDGVGFGALAVVAWFAASRAGDGLATWLGSSSLWRIFPQNPAVLTACFAVAPAFAALVVTLTGCVALGLSPWFPFACSIAVVAGQIRRARRPDMQLGTMVDTGLGALPLGIVARLLHGPDVVIVVMLVAIRSWTLAGALAVALACRCVVREVPGR